MPSTILLLMLTMSLFMMEMKAYGQAADCDTIYSFPSTAPHYANDKKGLSDYFFQALMPIIANCNQRDDMLISSLNILLTINRNGNVIDASFTRQHLSPICKDELMKKLLTMTG